MRQIRRHTSTPFPRTFLKNPTRWPEPPGQARTRSPSHLPGQTAIGTKALGLLFLRRKVAKADLSAGRLDIHTVVIAFAGTRPTAPAVARASPTSSRIANIRSFRAMRTNGAVPNAAVTHNIALATTLLQTGNDPRRNVIHELDRARILALQDRVRNQVVGP